MSTLQVILNQDMPNLGKMGEVIKVKRGYARNLLFPRDMAAAYTPENMKVFEKRRAELEQRQKEMRSEQEKMHDALDGYELRVEMRAGEEGQLYGSITQSNMVDLLRGKDFALKRNLIQMPEGHQAIKTVGEFDIVIHISPDLLATLKLIVKPTADNN